MNMIALGGAIGTGLFVAGGGSKYPLVWWCSCGLWPHRHHGIFPHDIPWGNGDVLANSGSFGTYAKRYVSPAFGFALELELLV